MKKNLLIFTVMPIVLLVPAHAAPTGNTVVLDPNLNVILNAPTSPIHGLPGIQAYAGQTVANPAPGPSGIPNLSDVIEVDEVGDITFYPPDMAHMGAADSIYVPHLTLASFGLGAPSMGSGGGSGANPTLPTLSRQDISVSDHAGLTMNANTTSHSNETLENEKPTDAGGMDGLNFLVMILTGQDDLVVVGNTNAPPGTTPNLGAVDAANATIEAPPDVVPDVGEFGGPVDEIM